MPSRRRTGRRLRRARPWIVGAIIVLAVGAVGAWLASSWLGTYRLAQAFQSDVSALRSAVSGRDWEGVTAQVPVVLATSEQLATRTQSAPWRLLEHVPFVGSDAAAVSDIAQAATGLLRAAEPLTPFAQRIVDGQVRRADGAVDLAAVQEVAPLLDRLAHVARAEIGRLQAIDTSGLRPQLGDPIAQLRDELATAAPGIATAAELAHWLPGLLGADGDRSWLVLLQNPAEARGTGGFPGGYVRIGTHDGRLSVLSSAKSKDLATTTIPIDGAPADAQLLWGDFLKAWNTFNMSPDFPMVAGLAAAGMQERGEPVDGVLAVDPAAVAAMLSITGPVTVRGQTVTAENAAQYFTVDSYAAVPDLNERDEITMELVRAVLQRFLQSSWDPIVLADALRQSVAEGRLRVWSADPVEEEWLLQTPVGGGLPSSRGPVIAVAFNNAAGNKMDAFVRTAVDYRPGMCPTARTQTSSAAISLGNEAPTNLPLESNEYGRQDDPTAPEGSTNMLVHFYAPVGAEYVTSSLDGTPLPLYVGEERGRPVWWTFVELDRGQTRTLDITFTEPTVAGADPTVLTQGMVIPEQTSVEPNTGC